MRNWLQIIKVKEIRRRLLYLLWIVILVRLGSQVMIPGVNREALSAWMEQDIGGSVLDFINLFTGGSFERMSLFALGITPYITASIILQLLTVAIPALEEMSRDGQSGREKMVAITRILTLALSAVEGLGLALGFGRQGIFTDSGVMAVITVILGVTAGSVVLMFLGERITEKAVGNGISVILTMNIIGRIPSDISGLYENFVGNKTLARGGLSALIILAVIAATVILAIVISAAEHRVPVQYSRKMSQGSNVQKTHLPIRMNLAGVIAVIFASSVMSMPVLLASLMGRGSDGIVLGGLTQANWFNMERLQYMWGYILYLLLIVFFCYFQTRLSFQSSVVAEDLRRRGGVIPGIRSGRPTEEYLDRILGPLIFLGAVGTCIVVSIPLVFSGLFNASVNFGGTSLFILVSVFMETGKQIEGLAVQRNVESFM